VDYIEQNGLYQDESVINTTVANSSSDKGKEKDLVPQKGDVCDDMIIVQESS